MNLLADEPDLGFRDELAGNLRFSAKPPHQLALVELAHVIFDDITRYHGPAKPRLVDDRKIDARQRPRLRETTDGACRLCHALDDEHTWHDGVIGKVAGKEGLIGGDVLDADT